MNALSLANILVQEPIDALRQGSRIWRADRSTLAPVVLTPGTGVRQEVGRWLYAMWLNPGAHVLVPLPGRGIDHVEQTYSSYQANMQVAMARLQPEDKKPIGIGHSQGTYHLVRWVLDHPGYFSQVVAVAGLFNGLVFHDF